MSSLLAAALLLVGALGLVLVFVLSGWAARERSHYRRLLLITTVLTSILVVVGAYVRLSDAGLGCPDWPGCYGQPQVPQALPEGHAAVSAGGVDAAKGWKEMGHRYLASFVGLLIASIAIAALIGRERFRSSPRIAWVLVAVVIAQAALGRWTVTLLLKPAIVTLHLVGGMTTLGLLTWLTLRAFAQGAARSAGRATVRTVPWRLFAMIALVLVAVQIILGGWVSSNYAALACPDLPLCRGDWMPTMHFAQAFEVVRELGRTGDGQLLSLEVLTAIHWTHRIWAIVVFLYCLGFGFKLARTPRMAKYGWGLIALACVQVSLGVANVLLSLPLAVAAAHNAGAAALLVWVIVINFCACASAQDGEA